MPIITLTTDFGLRDPFVGIMKGVILGICPDARLIDLTHDVAPQDVEGGALALEQAIEFFPLGTVHLAVIDPGVGSARRALAGFLGWASSLAAPPGSPAGGLGACSAAPVSTSTTPISGISPGRSPPREPRRKRTPYRAPLSRPAPAGSSDVEAVAGSAVSASAGAGSGRGAAGALVETSAAVRWGEIS